MQSKGELIASARIAKERELKTGLLDLGMLGLGKWPDELWELTHLTDLNLGRHWTDLKGVGQREGDIGDNTLLPAEARWSKFPALRRLSVSGAWAVRSSWNNLEGIAALTHLEVLNCAGTEVESLEPLADLPHLQAINCSGTQVSSLEPLKALVGLKSLDCSLSSVSCLKPLTNLTSLQSLQCFRTRVISLDPLKDLRGLEVLSCASTRVQSLAPLANLPALKSLHCFDTQITDLKALEGSASLEVLNCASTEVNSLEPLSELMRLRVLHCSNTHVSSLLPLTKLRSLQTLHCSRAPINAVPEALVWQEALMEFYCQRTATGEIPAEVFSRTPKDNCLGRIRAHFRDLEAGEGLLSDVKVLVLGNGRIGKTQICNRLRGRSFETDADSTHGITVTAAGLSAQGITAPCANKDPETSKTGSDISAAGAEGETLMRLWDFGGQDLYYGTHGLFMRTKSIFVLVWTPESESNDTYEHNGTRFRNHSVHWWLNYILCTAGPDVPVLILQNQCDRPEMERCRSPVDEAVLNQFKFKRELHYSALLDLGRPTLDDALRQASAWLKKQHGQARIGKGRLLVKQQIDALRNEDAEVSQVSQRRHRTITRDQFQSLCIEAGGVSDPQFLLDYLHHSGVLFYQKGVFGNQIILDQAWALDAIYTVFNRKSCWHRLRRERGRFKRQLLESLVWQNHSRQEQELFLGLMKACGICFVHQPGDVRRGIEAEYIAPDLLPDFEELKSEVAAKWDSHAKCDELVVKIAFLHPGLMPNLLSRIGQRAGMSGVYWRDGVCVYEKQCASRGYIVLRSPSPECLTGSLHIKAQGGRSSELLAILKAMVLSSILDSRLRLLTAVDEQELLKDVENVSLNERSLNEPEFKEHPRRQPTYGISYAWNDASKEIVNRLCEEAAAKHEVTILRDTTGIGLGDSIIKFMSSLAEQDLIFVILSSKYLESPNCMYELWHIWLNCRGDDDEFRRRVCVYRMPDAEMMTISSRARCAKFWKDQLQELDVLVRKEGAGILGESDFKRFKLMQDFANRVSDILGLIADTLSPRDFDDLKRRGFRKLN